MEQVREQMNVFRQSVACWVDFMNSIKNTRTKYTI